MGQRPTTDRNWSKRPRGHTRETMQGPRWLQGSGEYMGTEK